MESSPKPQQQLHVLMVSFPGQGHVNPLLRLAKILASKGLLITFTTTEYFGNLMQQSTTNASPVTPIGDGHLRFEFFSDGLDVTDPKRFDLDTLMHQLETFGKESFTELIKQQFDQGRPVSCVINNPFVPWASDVATDLGIPCALLWVQSCALFAIYHHYHHSLTPFPTVEQPNRAVSIPGLPTLDVDDVPSFLLPWKLYGCLKDAILGQFKNLEKSFCILVDSIDELERETIEHVTKLSPIKPVGPLFKSLIGSGNIKGDMWKAAENCVQWLDTQNPSSVVYVSFGSVVSLKKEQKEEIASGLLNSGSPFIWVVRPDAEETKNGSNGLPDGFMEKAEGRGLVVQWSPQEQVLAHPNLACFLTHCGWNSSMESLSCGVPIIGFPQWGDQLTNAKILVEVYGVGVRMRTRKREMRDGEEKEKEEEDQMVMGDEVERCIFEVTKGLKAEEMKRNALKWKKVADEAVVENGSSFRNLQAFVDDIQRMGGSKENIEISVGLQKDMLQVRNLELKNVV